MKKFNNWKNQIDLRMTNFNMKEWRRKEYKLNLDKPMKKNKKKKKKTKNKLKHYKQRIFNWRLRIRSRKKKLWIWTSNNHQVLLLNLLIIIYTFINIVFNYSDYPITIINQDPSYFDLTDIDDIMKKISKKKENEYCNVSLT